MNINDGNNKLNIHIWHGHQQKLNGSPRVSSLLGHFVLLTVEQEEQQFDRTINSTLLFSEHQFNKVLLFCTLCRCRGTTGHRMWSKTCGRASWSFTMVDQRKSFYFVCWCLTNITLQYDTRDACLSVSVREKFVYLHRWRKPKRKGSLDVDKNIGDLKNITTRSFLTNRRSNSMIYFGPIKFKV